MIDKKYGRNITNYNMLHYKFRGSYFLNFNFNGKFQSCWSTSWIQVVEIQFPAVYKFFLPTNI